MSRNSGRTVYFRSDGQWADKANDTLRASGLYPSREDACRAAENILRAAGGGQLTVKNELGQIDRHEVVSS